jgi:DNA polymerase sigma
MASSSSSSSSSEVIWTFTPDPAEAAAAAAATFAIGRRDDRDRDRRRGGGGAGGGRDARGGPFRGGPGAGAGAGAGAGPGYSGRHVTFGEDGKTSSVLTSGENAPWKQARALAAEIVLLSGGGDDDDDDEEEEEGAAPPRQSAAAAAAAAALLKRTGFASPPSRSPLLRLHEEILDFAAFVTPTPGEVRIAAKALGVVRRAILDLFPHARTEVFGSRANGLVLPTSDWDVVLFGVQPTSLNMHRIAGELTRRGLLKKSEVIDSARVPIVKLWEKESGIQLDISFEARSAIVTRALIADYLSRYPPVRPLVLVLKYFLSQRGLNDTYSGGVGSFLLVLMAVHVVQAKLREAGLAGEPVAAGTVGGAAAAAAAPAAGPGQKRRREDEGGAPAAAATPAVSNGLNLGVLFLSFLELYGHTLNTTTTGVSVRGPYGGYYSKSERGWFDPSRPTLLSLENPAETTADTGKSSWGMDRVRRAFRHAHSCISRAVREWAADGGQGRGARAGGAGAGAGASSSSSSSSSAAAQSPSLLAHALNIDKLLVERAAELNTERDELRGDAGGALAAVRGGAAQAQKAPVVLELDDEDDEDDGRREGDARAGHGARTGKRMRGSRGDDDAPAGRKGAVPTGGGVSAAPVAAAGSVAAAAAAVVAPAAATSTSSSSSSSHAPSDATVRAMRVLEASAASADGGKGIALRHVRLLADILTRKERGVDGVSAAPPPGTY